MHEKNYMHDYIIKSLGKNMTRYTYIKLLALTVAVLSSGCANNQYLNELKQNDFLYQIKQDAATELLISEATKSENLVRKLGKNKSGYVQPDNSEERLLFENKFPMVKPAESDYASLTGTYHELRSGQVVLLSVDLDKRTSGYLKETNGTPISISGRFQIDESKLMSGSLMTGAIAGVAIGATNISLTNSNLSNSGLKLTPAGQNNLMLSGVATGLIGGLFVGMITSAQMNSALDGIINSSSFGERMVNSTFVLEMPHARPLRPDGRIDKVRITEGIVKKVLTYSGPLEADYRQRCYLISIIAVYRGKLYADKYANTQGWEYIITNINMIRAPRGSADPEANFRGIKKALIEQNIDL